MSRFNVLVTADAFRASGAEAERPIREAGGAILYPPRMGPLPEAELIPHLREADAVIASTDPYRDSVLSACSHLRVIARWGTGYDSVDLASCTAHGVVACNAPGLNVEAVADHVFAVLLALARQVPRQVAVMRAGGWEEIRGVELSGKTVGIIGFGAIGKAVARRARGFGCRILAFDPLLDAAAAAAHEVTPLPLERLCEEADFVTLHAALTPENRAMIGADLLRRMKRTAYFVNAARGPLVDEEALVRALSEGWIAGASVDTYTREPLPPDHPLRTLPSCLPTPHSAFNTVEVAAATNRTVAEQVLAVLRGEQPPHALNPEVFATAGFRGREPLLR